MKNPRLLARRALFHAVLALVAAARLVAAGMVVEVAPVGVSVRVGNAVGAVGAAALQSHPVSIPTAAFARSATFQLDRLSATPGALGAVPTLAAAPDYSSLFHQALQAHIQTGVPRAEAVAVQGALLQALADPTTLAAVEDQLRRAGATDRAAKLAALAQAANTDAARASLARYAGGLRDALAAAVSGDDREFSRVFDGLAVRTAEPAAPAVDAGAGVAAETGSARRARTLKRGLPVLVRAPVETVTLPISFPETERKYADKLKRWAFGVQPGTFGDFDLLTKQHLESHLAQANDLKESGALSPTAYDFTMGFIRDHDRAYVFASPADIESRKPELTQAWTAVSLALVPGDKRYANARATKAYDFVRRSFDKPAVAKIFETEAGTPEAAARGMAFGYSKLVGTILGHGSLSIVESRRTLEAAGFAPDPALGFALLLALHHPNFPITLVEGFAKGLAAKSPTLSIPDDLLGPLMIREGLLKPVPGMTPQERSALMFKDSESLRSKVSDYAAKLIGISKVEARQMALLGYALDRITAARRNFPDARDFRRTDGVPSFTAWDKPGKPQGEIVKKYGLILTNIMNANEIKTAEDARRFTLEAAFGKSIDSIVTETDAAIEAVKYAIADPSLEMTKAQRAQFASLRRTVESRAYAEVGRTKKIQNQALAFAKTVPGFSGLTIDLDADIDRVHEAALRLGPDHPDYDAASFLLTALVAMRTGPTNQATLAALAAVPR